MLRLAQPTEPFWLDMGGGVRFKVRPPSLALMETARAASKRKLEELRTHQAELRTAGATVSGMPDLTDPDVFSGQFSQRLAQTIAVFAIVEWEGVATAEGAPAPLTPANVEAAMSIDQVGRGFLGLYLTSIETLVAEGNGSAPAPNGSSAAGANTAADAAPAVAA
jgi:hypothetical protein